MYVAIFNRQSNRDRVSQRREVRPAVHVVIEPAVRGIPNRQRVLEEASLRSGNYHFDAGRGETRPRRRLVGMMMRKEYPFGDASAWSAFQFAGIDQQRSSVPQEQRRIHRAANDSQTWKDLLDFRCTSHQRGQRNSRGGPEELSPRRHP